MKRFPFDAVKIDRAFTREVTNRPEDASLTKAIIAMARALDMQTVAEGVETEGQLRFLRRHGCDAIQGYFFSRPLPADELTALLRNGKQLYPSDSNKPDSTRTLAPVDKEHLSAALRAFVSIPHHPSLTPRGALKH